MISSHLAKELGFEAKHEMYAALRDAEKERIEKMFGS